MKQMALDIGLQSLPSLESFFAGPNLAALQHLKLWTSGNMPSPVPTYLWGEAGSGKTHLLRAAFAALKDHGLMTLNKRNWRLMNLGWLSSWTMFTSTT